MTRKKWWRKRDEEIATSDDDNFTDNDEEVTGNESGGGFHTSWSFDPKAKPHGRKIVPCESKKQEGRQIFCRGSGDCLGCCRRMRKPLMYSSYCCNNQVIKAVSLKRKECSFISDKTFLPEERKGIPGVWLGKMAGCVYAKQALPWEWLHGIRFKLRTSGDQSRPSRRLLSGSQPK